MSDFTNKEKQTLKDIYNELVSIVDCSDWSNPVTIKDVFKEARKDRGADSARMISINGFIYGAINDQISLVDFSHFASDYRTMATVAANCKSRDSLREPVKTFAAKYKEAVENIQHSRIKRVA